MATGTALFAMSATSSEQRISGELADGAWTVSVAEGATMVGMSAAEGLAPGSNGPLFADGADQRWAGAGAPFVARYGVLVPPTPAAGNPPYRTFDGQIEGSRLTGANYPSGLAGFAPPLRSGDATYPALGRSPRAPALRALVVEWFGTSDGTGATRKQVTGFGETRMLKLDRTSADPSDLLDPVTGSGTGFRGQRTTVATVRAYVDRFE
jgi:hypothetical protein